MYSNSLSQKAGDLIERDFATLYEDANVVDATRLMNNKNTSSIIIRLKGSEEPIESIKKYKHINLKMQLP